MSKSVIAEEVLRGLQDVLKEKEGFVPLHEPFFTGREWDYVKKCLDTGWVSSVGQYVDRFEEGLAQYTGVRRAVAVVNGTSALHTCLLLAGIMPDDEVLMPGLTFVATANAVSYCHAVPHFVDSEERTLGLAPHKLERYLQEIGEPRAEGLFNKITGRRIKAVVPMHMFGHPVDLDPLQELCERHRLELIEDAAESLGSMYKGKHTGHWGKLTALSFNGNKTITTGGGGAILTDDNTLADLAKHMTTTAKVPHRWDFYHDMVGYNYRMPNLNAALGCAQLEKLPQFIAAKRHLAEKYRSVLSAIEGVNFYSEPDFAKSNYWLNTLLIDDDDISLRDSILELTNDHGLMTRPAWTLLSELPMYAECPKMDLSVAMSLQKRIINIPSSVNL